MIDAIFTNYQCLNLKKKQKVNLIKYIVTFVVMFIETCLLLIAQL